MEDRLKCQISSLVKYCQNQKSTRPAHQKSKNKKKYTTDFQISIRPASKTT